MYDYAVSKLSNKKRAVDYGVIDHIEADRIKKATGLDVDGYKRVIDNYAIRHILKRHGDPKTEEAKQQIAITKEDIELIPWIIDTADTIGKGETEKDVETIAYQKKVNETIYVYEEMRTGKGELVPTTMYKKRVATNDMPPARPLGETSSDTSETLRNSFKGIIQPSSESVKPVVSQVEPPDIQLMPSLNGLVDTGKLSIEDALEIDGVARQNNWLDDTVKQFHKSAVEGLGIQNKETQGLASLLVTAKIKEAVYKQNAEKYKQELVEAESQIERISKLLKIEGGVPDKYEALNPPE